MTKALKLSNNYWDISACSRKDVTSLKLLSNSFVTLDCGWFPGNNGTTTTAPACYPNTDMGHIKGSNASGTDSTSINFTTANAIKMNMPFKNVPVCFGSVNLLSPPDVAGGCVYGMGLQQDGRNSKQSGSTTLYEIRPRITPPYNDTAVRRPGLNWVAFSELI